MNGKVRQWATSKWSILLTLALLASAGALLVVSIVNTNNYQRCVATWADRYTDRVNRLSAVNSDHNNATDAVIQALNTALLDAIRKDQAALARDVPAYQRAVSEYQATATRLAAAQKANPVPDSPRLNC